MFPFWLLIVAILIAGTGVLAQSVHLAQPVDKPANSGDRNEPIGGTVIPSEEAEAAKEHWTPQRMRNAKEKPLLHADPNEIQRVPK
jgi:hypothetical protein